MELIFLGTPEFAVPSLQALMEAGHKVLAVYTQPDRPKGRGAQLAASPVKRAAIGLGLPVFQPERIRRPEAVEQLRAFRPEAMAVVGYGQIVPQSILDIPPLGIVNVHASLLPKYRGAAPVQWAIANGESVTGVTTMRIDAGLDTGDMLLKWKTAIGPGEDAVELGTRLAHAGAGLLVETLDGLANGSVVPEPQNAAEATLAPILKKEDGRIDWHQRATAIYNRARGFLPWPGAFTSWREQLLHVWKCRPAIRENIGEPGEMRVSGKRLLIGCGGETALELLEVQAEGRKRLSAEAFLNGYSIREGERAGGEGVRL